ncbi:MAG: PfkB family carbohydrate kinase [Balneolaceae bacterium]|nr:PfkB family carbohydrate kinase [Balneolaceae bacterium]
MAIPALRNIISKLITKENVNKSLLAICPNPSVDKVLHLKRLQTGKVNRCIDEKFYPGGKGVHVGLALKELQTDTKIAGFWSGPTGDWIQTKCSSYNVPSVGVHVEGWNRTCLTILTSENNKTDNTEILEIGPRISNQSLNDFFKVIEKETVEVKAMCVSGSWPKNCPKDVYQRLSSICERNNTDLWIDASGKRLQQALDVKPFGIHINKKEAKDLLGTDTNPVEYTEKLLTYCNVVALTDGANGLFLGYQDSILHAVCKVQDIVSTVGSGDCLTAGLLHAWYKEKELSTIAKTATACGAANCINPDLGMLQLSDVIEFEKKTTVESVR